VLADEPAIVADERVDAHPRNGCLAGPKTWVQWLSHQHGGGNIAVQKASTRICAELTLVAGMHCLEEAVNATGGIAIAHVIHAEPPAAAGGGEGDVSAVARSPPT